MVMFKINDEISVVAEYGKSRDGFNHFATLYLNGREMDRVKVHYINRTWERYEFDSVIEKLAEKSPNLSKEQRQIIKDWVKNRGDDSDEGMRNLKSIGMVAMLGEMMAGDSIKAKNDWKARMLKAGLGNSGLEMPDDWETLSEKEKERRLNQAIGVLRK